MIKEPIVESPCINVCSMNNATGYCEGCYRTIDEIQGWWDYTLNQKADVINKAWARQEAAFD